ncbi:MAG: APC family permease [Gammaproteobacteria bacterium]
MQQDAKRDHPTPTGPAPIPDGPGRTVFERVLQTRDVVALAFGAMIGWSWVLLTGFWVDTAGSLGTLIAFLAGGAVIALIGLTYAELAAAMPEAGGEHVWTWRALGPGPSFVCTWALLMAYVNVCLFEAVALPTAVEYLLPDIRLGTLWTVRDAPVDLGFVLIGAGSALLMTVLNLFGIRTAARAQAIGTAMILFAALLLLTGAIAFGEPSRAEPWIGVPATGILTVLIMVPTLLVGFDVVPQSAEEIRLPPRQIGRLLVFSVLMAVAFYGVISLGVAVALEPADIKPGSLATGDAATALWGHPLAGQLLVLGGVAGILTSWNAFIVGGSRVLYGLALSGQAPAIFGWLHPRYRTPWAGILLIGVLSMLAPLCGRTVLVWMVNAGSFATMIAYLFVPIAFLALRRSAPDLPRPYRVSRPRLVGRSAIVLALLLLACFLPWSPSALVWPWEWGMILVWALIGAGVFLGYRPRTQSDPRADLT